MTTISYRMPESKGYSSDTKNAVRTRKIKIVARQKSIVGLERASDELKAWTNETGQV
jgi:hypothetical protein